MDAPARRHTHLEGDNFVAEGVNKAGVGNDVLMKASIEALDPDFARLTVLYTVVEIGKLQGLSPRVIPQCISSGWNEHRIS